jgi:hypothetical protein
MSTIDTDAQPLEGGAAFGAKAVELVKAARSEVLLLTESLDRRLYLDDALTSALKEFLLAREQARLRVLVLDASQAMHNLPRLAELFRRLCTQVELRKPPDERRSECRREWLIADRRGLLERHDSDALLAQYWQQAPQRGKSRSDVFDEIWKESEPDSEMRTLGI